MGMLQITIETTGPAAASKKDRRDILRDSFGYLAGLWDKIYKMKRFGPGAKARYGFAARRGEAGSGRPYKGSYQESKVKGRKNGDGVKSIGEGKALVWSGNSRSQAEAQHKIVAKAASHTRGYAENVFLMPTLNLTPATGRIKLRKEFETVTEQERKSLEGLGALYYENKINAAGPRKFQVA